MLLDARMHSNYVINSHTPGPRQYNLKMNWEIQRKVIAQSLALCLVKRRKCEERKRWERRE